MFLILALGREKQADLWVPGYPELQRKKKNIQMKMAWCCFVTYTSSMCFSFQTAIHSCPVLIYWHFLYFICLFFFYYVLLTIQEGWGKDLVNIVVPIQTQAWLQHTLSQEYPMSTSSLHMHVLHTGRYSYVFHLIFEGQGQGWAVWSLAMISLMFRSIEK